MREEIKLWFETAKKMYEAARKNFENKLYFVSAFYIHQSIEFSLKALWIKKKKEYPPKTHNIIFLAKELGLPEKLLNHCREINREYTVSRYPDAANGFPFELYSEDTIKRYLEMGEEIIKYVEDEINR